MKKIIIFSMAAIMALSLTACGTNSDNGTDEASNTNNANESIQAINGDGSMENISAVSNGEENGVDMSNMLYGEVYEIVGNSVTLKIIETPDRMPGMMPGMSPGFNPEMMQGNPEGGRFTIEGGADGEPVSIQGGRIRDGEERVMRDGTAPNGEGRQITVNEDGTITMTGSGGETYKIEVDADGNRKILDADGNEVEANSMAGNMGMDMTVKYTGEEREIIIPVGLPIYTTTFDREKMEMVETEVKLESVKAGGTLMITFAEDGETIEKVISMASTGMGMGRIGMDFGGEGTFFFGEGSAVIIDGAGGGDIQFYAAQIGD